MTRSVPKKHRSEKVELASLQPPTKPCFRLIVNPEQPAKIVPEAKHPSQFVSALTSFCDALDEQIERIKSS